MSIVRVKALGACLAGFLMMGDSDLATAGPARERQYIIISFDGAQHISQWQRSRALAQETGARFTYFLSCVYLLTPESRKAYQGPKVAAGRSNVGVGASTEDVAARLDQMWSARQEGHEIASHGCGHFDGKGWSKDDWLDEFSAFSKILLKAYELNGLDNEPEGWRRFAAREIIGFRAPYLSTNDGLFAALAERGYAYDASTVSRGPATPQTSGGIIRFSLPLIPEGPRQRPIIAMDYNLYVRHSGGEEMPDKAALFSDRAYNAFMSSLETEMASARRPLQIGFHFTLMNEGAYWTALENFARTVCTRAEIRCVSYQRYLEETGALRREPS